MTAKLIALKADLETTIASELASVKEKINMLVIGRCVTELSKRQRNQYRDLLIVRDHYEHDLSVVKTWCVDQFRRELIANNPGIYSWLGWKN